MLPILRIQGAEGRSRRDFHAVQLPAGPQVPESSPGGAQRQHRHL